MVAGTGTGTLCSAAYDRDGHPYGSFVTFGLLEGGDPTLLISTLAEHTKNLQQEARVSLLVAETGDGDPLALGRVTLVARGAQLERGSDAETEARAAFLAAHPQSGYYADFKDFNFWRLQVEAVRYIGGYGRMSWVDATDWAAARPDPLMPSAKRILDHMNSDHRSTMALYCRAFTKATGAQEGEVTMTGVDRYGFELSVQTPEGPRPVRLAYAEPALTADACRKALVALAKDARAATAA